MKRLLRWLRVLFAPRPCVHQEEIDEWNNPCLRCRGRKS